MLRLPVFLKIDPWKECSAIAATVLLCATFQLPTLAQVSPSPTAELSHSIYRLGSGDQLDITVFDYEEFTGSKVILPDGTIVMPMIGAVAAAGKTTEQLAKEITARLQSLLVNPVVSVNLSALRPVSVNVAGEVMRPGTIQLRSLTTASPALRNIAEVSDSTTEGTPTVSTALIAAGGITRNADIRHVVLKRQGNPAEPIVINLWDAIASENAPPDFILQDGDSLYIPHLKTGETLDTRLSSRSSFAPATVRVRIVGEVKSPGEVRVSPDSSISSAVAIAGGPTEDARLSRVAFVRLNEAGQVERQMVDLSNLVDNYQIQDGDVIIVPKRSSSSFIDLAGRVLGPFGVLFNLFR